MLASKPVTVSLKVKVNVTAPVATAAVSSVMARVGMIVSNSWLTCAGAVAWLPAVSVIPAVLTSTVMVPCAPASGVTTRV